MTTPESVHLSLGKRSDGIRPMSEAEPSKPREFIPFQKKSYFRRIVLEKSFARFSSFEPEFRGDFVGAEEKRVKEIPVFQINLQFPDDPESTAVLKELDRVVLNRVNDGEQLDQADKIKILPKTSFLSIYPFKDVDQVVRYAHCTTRRAEEALLKCGGNVVDAILEIEHSSTDPTLPLPKGDCPRGDCPRGVDPDEVEIAMQQSGCSRQKAILALLKHGNVVDAILELTP